MNFFGSFPGYQTQWGGNASSTYGNRPSLFASSNSGFNRVGYQAAPEETPVASQAPQAQPQAPQMNYEQMLMALLGGGGGGGKGMGGGVPYASGGRGYGSALGGSGMYGSPEQDRARQQYQAGGLPSGGFNPFLINGFRPMRSGR